jgi:hypothetical protein
MRIVLLALVGGLTFLLASCSSGSGTKSGTGTKEDAKQPAASTPSRVRELIIGKWEMIESPNKNTIEFMPEGVYKLVEVSEQGVPGAAVDGKYQFKDDETVVIDLGVVQYEQKVKVNGDELVITDSKGKADKYRRRN